MYISNYYSCSHRERAFVHPYVSLCVKIRIGTDFNIEHHLRTYSVSDSLLLHKSFEQVILPFVFALNNNLLSILFYTYLN